MNRALAFTLVLLLVLSGLIVQQRISEPAADKPAQPFIVEAKDVPTLAQIRSAAQDLQAQINAAAGRKTNPALDGTGGSLTPPSEIAADTAWVNKYVSFTSRMYLNITDNQ